MSHSRLCSILCLVVCLSASQSAEGGFMGTISCEAEGKIQILDDRVSNTSWKISGVKFNLVANNDSGFGKFSNDGNTIFKFITIRNTKSYYFGYIKKGIGNGSWPHIHTNGSIEVFNGKFRLIENNSFQSEISIGRCQ